LQVLRLVFKVPPYHLRAHVNAKDGLERWLGGTANRWLQQ
jgi:hypothetical protein